MKMSWACLGKGEGWTGASADYDDLRIFVKFDDLRTVLRKTVPLRVQIKGKKKSAEPELRLSKSIGMNDLQGRLPRTQGLKRLWQGDCPYLPCLRYVPG